MAYTKSCPTKVNCRISCCNKRRHTSLHEWANMNPSKKIASNSLNSVNLEVKTFLEIIPITISIGSKYVKVSALVDTTFKTTLIKGSTATKLALYGSC